MNNEVLDVVPFPRDFMGKQGKTENELHPRKKMTNTASLLRLNHKYLPIPN